MLSGVNHGDLISTAHLFSMSWACRIARIARSVKAWNNYFVLGNILEPIEEAGQS
jgi:hypothetical protein